MKRLSVFSVCVFGWSIAASGQRIDPATTCYSPVAPVDDYHVGFGPFLDLDNFQKYHLGEDWNDWNGLDLGKSVYAVANGKVVKIQDIDTRDRWGKVIVIEHLLLTNRRVYSLYAHLQSIGVNVGDIVAGGEVIGTIGNSNGYYGPHNNSGPHLHFEIRNDADWQSGDQGYTKPPLNLSVARRYKNPSLFIDDRSGLQPVSLATNKWQVVVPSINGSMATTFVTFDGRNMSYNQAAVEKLVSGTVQYRWPGELTWKNLTVTKTNWFAGVEYRVLTHKTGVVLNLVLPGHNYQTERVVQDFIWLAWSEGRFKACQPETIADYPVSDARYHYRQMTCQFERADGSLAAIPIYHATSLRHELFRFLGYYDPENNRWSGWKALSPGNLDP